MARGPRYKVPRRRRREGKTNYRKRYRMLLSGKPRLVVRKTLNSVWVQLVVPRPEGDYTVAAANSHELAKRYGWRAGTANTPAAYLTGLLAGLRALKAGIGEAIPDIGLHKATKGGMVFAALKGALDAGMKIPVSDEVIPAPERIRGEHIAAWAKILGERGLLERYFSNYIKNGLNPVDLPSHFEEVRKAILKSYGVES
ncbi:MAG: 50S ribosomal protein L18 [Desulfurococcaceae archaeon]